MASLSQLAKELLLGLAGGDPVIQQEYIDGMGGSGGGAVLADGSVPFTAPEQGVDPVASNDLSTKNYVDNHVVDVPHGGTGRTSALVGTNIHVDPSGSDTTGDGSPTNPYKTIAHAQATFSDESISTGIGPEKNGAKQYNIMISGGTFSEINSWKPKQYVNYIGSGPSSTFIQHISQGTAIDFAYGDNYGFSQTFQGISFTSELDPTRIAGFTNPTNLPTSTNLIFDDCDFQQGFDGTGSGHDNGSPDIVGDFYNFNRCTCESSIVTSAVTVNAQDTIVSGFLVLDSTGVDGSVPVSGGQPNTFYGCQVGIVELFDYVNVAFRNSEVLSVNLQGRVNDPTLIAINGSYPGVLMDADSTANVHFHSGALPDQVARFTSNIAINGVYRTGAVTTTPYVSHDDQIISSNLDTPGPVSITLSGQGIQEVIDYKGDAATNNITVIAPRYLLIKGGGSGGTTWTIAKNSEKVTFIYNPFDTSDGLPQISDIQTVADVSGSLNNKYFNLYVMTGQSQQILFVPWFNVDGGGTVPGGLPSGAITLEVDISSNASADDVAAALLVVLQQFTNGIYDVSAYADAEPGASNEITVTDFNSGPVTDISDGIAPTGFALSTSQAGVDRVDGTFTPHSSLPQSSVEHVYATGVLSLTGAIDDNGSVVLIDDFQVPSGKKFYVENFSVRMEPIDDPNKGDYSAALAANFGGGYNLKDNAGNLLASLTGTVNGGFGVGGAAANTYDFPITAYTVQYNTSPTDGMVLDPRFYQGQGTADGNGVTFALNSPGNLGNDFTMKVYASIWGVIK